MPITLQHTQEEDHHLIPIQTDQASAILSARETLQGRLMAITDLQCPNPEAPSILQHLSKALHEHPTLSKPEWMIHVRPTMNALLATLIATGWQIASQKLLYRTALDEPQPTDFHQIHSGQQIQLIPATNLPPEEFAHLLHASHQGNPDEPHLHTETPEAFLNCWRCELADLHRPDLEFVAMRNGHPIGLYSLRTQSHATRTIGFINHIGIHPDHRRSGLGTHLHRLAIHHLRHLGCTHYIGSTRSTNTPMQALFHRNAIPEVSKQVFLRATAHCPH